MRQDFIHALPVIGYVWRKVFPTLDNQFSEAFRSKRIKVSITNMSGYQFTKAECDVIG